MDKTSLGDRMKKYENINRQYLIPNMPTIIRLDGKAFHSFTKGMKRPFDDVLINSMNETAKYLCKNIMGCKIAYVQSDEITLLLTDYDTIQTQSWFGGNIQKMVSISASMATMAFNMAFNTEIEEVTDRLYTYVSKIGTAMFDSRVFQMPLNEVINNFIWRQQDATRNSIQLVGYTYFSNKETYKKSCAEIQDMLVLQKGVNWNNFPTYQKRGRCIIKETYTLDNEEKSIRTRWTVDDNIPIFTQDRDYIEKFVQLAQK